MKHLFIPYDIALLAKEHGFNEECFAVWNNDKLVFSSLGHPRNSKQGYLTAPIYQQLVDWFRDVHGLVLDVFQEFNGTTYTGKWEVDVSKLKIYEDPHFIVIEERFDDYYEAWNEAFNEVFKII